MKAVLIAVAITIVAALTAPAYSQTKLDNGIILPKKHEAKKEEAPKATKDKAAEKAPKSDKKAAKK